MNTELRDVFLCHASEDKEEIVRPITEAFKVAGISFWYDEAEIKWGDSIIQNVNEGLRISRYVIVVLSATFIQKNWPQREINAVLNMEASSGKVKILPLLVGSRKEQEMIISKYPLLNDKRFLPWDGNVKSIVDAMLDRLGRKLKSSENRKGKIDSGVGIKIPLPKLQKKFSQRDKDLYLKEAFQEIKKYFRAALGQLERNYNEIETDYSEVHNFNFISTIYIRGEVASRCKIWIGGLSSSDSILYHSGRFIMNDDNSFNEQLSVTHDDQSLGFKPLMTSLYNQPSKDLLSVQEAAEYLWRRFTDQLG